MALVQRLEAKQGQGLVVTPQLQQAIKLLQLSNLELETFVESELERNPLLARDEREGDREAISPEPEAASPVESAADETSASLVQADLDAPAEDQFESETSISSERPEEWSSWAGRGGSFEPEGGELGETPVRPPSLREHLEAQLASTRFSEAARAVAVQFIDAVDEGGYLRADPAEVGQRLGAPAALVTEVLETLQGFEPTGVFARSVAECLKLQLIERGRLDEPMSAMLLHLDLVARSDLVGLRRVCDVDGLKLNQMIAELRSLTPRPGAAFGGEPAQTVIPDVFVREMTNGTWRVELNSDTLPRLLVDRRYYAKVSAAARDENESGFLSGCLASANWLVKSLD
ncbi:MAG: RNA polymerase factor sigma-54, partial [Caulobacteraceae bacterium]